MKLNQILFGKTLFAILEKNPGKTDPSEIEGTYVI